jgi:hypothetical protein
MIVLGALFSLTSFIMIIFFAYITALATSPKVDFCHGLCPIIFPTKLKFCIFVGLKQNGECIVGCLACHATRMNN